jgi:hypothetical protein
MACTLLSTPDDPDHGHAPPPAGVTLDEQALRDLDLLLGGHTRPVDTGPARPATADPTRVSGGGTVEDRPTVGHERELYLPMATCCYAVVLYDAAAARLVRRIVGMFADVESAEAYARVSGYRLYDVVPATAVTPALL